MTKNAASDNLPATQDTPTSLAVVAPQSHIIPANSENWDDIDDGAMGVMPDARIDFPRLVSDMRPGGGWTNELTGQKVEQLDVVWLLYMQTRGWWPDAFGQGNKAPDCRSADMVAPDPRSPNLQATLCGDCPHSEWVGDEPPACRTAYTAMVFDITSSGLLTVTFSGTAMKKVNRYLSSFKARLPRRPPAAYVTHISLEQIERDGMRWLEPVFAVGDELERYDVAPLISMRDEARKQWAQATADDLASAPAETVVATDEEPF